MGRFGAFDRAGRTTVVMAATVLLAAGCGGEPSGHAPSSATPTSPPATGGSAPRTGPPGASGERPAIADGRWPAYVTAVSPGTLTMDLVEFLTGDEAVREWQKRYPDADDKTPPNDYLIVNDNPRKRALPLSAAVSVKVVGQGSTADTEVGIAGLRHQLEHTLFWIDVRRGKVVQLREQFLP